MPENLELTSVQLTVLTMKECTDALFEGKTLLIKGIETSRGNDILVRLDLEGKIPVTQISYDLVAPDGYWRDQYWSVYDLPMNVFSTYSCFIYDEAVGKQMPKFVVADTVYYTSREDDTKDSAIVVDVLKDLEGNWFYLLSRDKLIYAEHEISKDRLK